MLSIGLPSIADMVAGTLGSAWCQYSAVMHPVLHADVEHRKTRLQLLLPIPP